MLTCRHARTLIVRTIDDETLPGEARAALRQHLSSCAGCREEYDTQHEVRRLLALQIEERLPAGFSERLNARLAQQPPRSLPAHPPLAAPAEWLEVASDTASIQDAVAGSARRGKSETRDWTRAASSSPASSWPASSVSSLSPAWSASPWRREVRWRTWGVRLVPVAATLALIVADTRLREFVWPTATSSSTSTSDGTTVTIAPPTPPRAGTPLRRRDHARGATDVPAREPRAAAHDLGTIAAAPQQDDVPLDARSVTGVAAGSPTATPVVPPSPQPAEQAELRTLPPVLAPEVAEDLKLSETQRKQIAEIYDLRRHTLHEILERTRKRVELERSETDAAIERILTPAQRKQYRERHASQGTSALPAAPAPILPAPIPPGPQFP